MNDDCKKKRCNNNNNLNGGLGRGVILQVLRKIILYSTDTYIFLTLGVVVHVSQYATLCYTVMRTDTTRAFVRFTSDAGLNC